MNVTHKVRSTLLVLFTIVTLVCGVTSGTKCTLRCDGITDDTQWEECMLECHQESAE